MVGIVGILLLGSLAWSAVGALVSAVSAASSALASTVNPPAPATLAPVAAVTPAPATQEPATLTLHPTATLQPTATAQPQSTATAQPQSTATAQPQSTAAPTAQIAARNPWILLPQPEPGTNVPPGAVTVEARGRGDAPITAMRLELDGAALPTAVEQRSDAIWRGSATARVTAGQHNVRAVVTDANGRSGSYRWTFTAAPAP